MTSRYPRSFPSAFNQPAIARLAGAVSRLAALLICLAAEVQANAADPAITQQPVGGQAALGESFGFSVDATGTPPLAYQWLLNGSALSLATNRSITLVNLTNTDSGTYTVVVTNSIGSITSAPAVLAINTTAPRTTTTGTVTGGAQATVPILLSANGRENRLTFTLGFNPNVFGNPSFTASVINDAVAFDTSRVAEGLVSGDVTLPAGTTFAAGRSEVGRLRFDFVTGTDPLVAGLYFTNASTAATNIAFATNGLPLIVNAVVSPQFEILTLAPALNRQSGLFEHMLIITYAGTGTLENVDLLISGLVDDSRNNRIRVYNSIGLKTIGPDAEGFYENVPFVSGGPLAAGASRNLTIEYYVTDHTTVPGPTYNLVVEGRTGFSISPSASPLNITTNRFVNGTFILQFPTRVKYRYNIQYAPTLDDLLNNSTNARVVNPAVNGTGYSLQWIDNGPPKTETPPVAGSRFYRVLEAPAQ